MRTGLISYTLDEFNCSDNLISSIHCPIEYDVIEVDSIEIEKASCTELFTLTGFKWYFSISVKRPQLLHFIVESIDGGNIYTQKMTISTSSRKVLTKILHADVKWTFCLLAIPFQLVIYPYLYALEKIGLLFHCAAISINEDAFMFLGASGAGKSTISRFFDKYFKENDLETQSCVINDEKCALAFSDYSIHSATISGGSARLSSSKTGILKGIFFIEKSSSFSISEISDTEKFMRLSQVNYAPYGIQQLMEETADQLLKIISKIPCKLLKFKNSDDTPKYFMQYINNAV